LEKIVRCDWEVRGRSRKTVRGEKSGREMRKVDITTSKNQSPKIENPRPKV